MNTDDALMRQAAQNNAEAFGVLVRAHEMRVSRFALRLLGSDYSTAQDITQETFLRVWRGRHAYVPFGSFSTYLLRIAHRLCLDALRRTRARALPLDIWADAESISTRATAPSAEQIACESGLADAVKAAVAALPETQRTVFILSHYEGVGYQEIACILECPIGTVASRRHHAVQNLRRLLADWNPDFIQGETHE